MIKLKNCNYIFMMLNVLDSNNYCLGVSGNKKFPSSIWINSENFQDYIKITDFNEFNNQVVEVDEIKYYCKVVNCWMNETTDVITKRWVLLEMI